MNEVILFLIIIFTISFILTIFVVKVATYNQTKKNTNSLDYDIKEVIENKKLVRQRVKEIKKSLKKK